MRLHITQAQIRNEAGREWAERVRARAQAASGSEVDLWERIYAPSTGTVLWTSWWADLSGLEQARDQLRLDREYQQLMLDGEGLATGTGERILQLVHGDPRFRASSNYFRTIEVNGTHGHFDHAVNSGIDLATHGSEISGVPLAFLRPLTGRMTSFVWLSEYEDLASYEIALAKLHDGEGWLRHLDHNADVFDGASLTHTLHRRLTSK